MQEERNVSAENEMRAEERERWKKGSSKLSHKRDAADGPPVP